MHAMICIIMIMNTNLNFSSKINVFSYSDPPALSAVAAITNMF